MLHAISPYAGADWQPESYAPQTVVWKPLSRATPHITWSYSIKWEEDVEVRLLAEGGGSGSDRNTSFVLMRRPVDLTEEAVLWYSRHVTSDSLLVPCRTTPNAKGQVLPSPQILLSLLLRSFLFVQTAWASRWDHYLKSADASNSKIHWFSIVNSLLIVLFLSGMVAMILLRALHKDFNRCFHLWGGRGFGPVLWRVAGFCQGQGWRENLGPVKMFGQ